MVGKGFDLRVWRVGVLRDGMRGMSEGVNCEGREGGLCSICMNIIDIAYRTLRYRECEGEGEIKLRSETEHRSKAKQGAFYLFYFGKNSL